MGKRRVTPIDLAAIARRARLWQESGEGEAVSVSQDVPDLLEEISNLRAALAAQSEESHKQVLELQGAIVTLETMRYRAEKAEGTLAASEAKVQTMGDLLQEIGVAVGGYLAVDQNLCMGDWDADLWHLSQNFDDWRARIDAALADHTP